MKALVVLMSVFLMYTVPVFAQDKKQVPEQPEQQTQEQQSDDERIELYQDPRKEINSRPTVVMPTGKVCKDSLLRDINGMDIPNEGQFPNPGNPNGRNDGTLNNNNGELPSRMNCNAINDIAPRQESLDSPLFENSPIVKDPE